MPTIWTFVRAAAVLVGSSAALLTGGIAHADPAPAPAPAPNIPQQLISSAANAPQILQNLATALGATPPLSAPKVAEPAPAAPGITATFPGLTPAAPAAAAAPALTPSIPGVNAPIPGITPAAPALPVTAPAAAPTIPGVNAPIPGITAPAPAAAAVPASVPGVPSAKVDLPQLPYLPLQVPQQLSLPADLPALASGVIPAAPIAAGPARYLYPAVTLKRFGASRISFVLPAGGAHPLGR